MRSSKNHKTLGILYQLPESWANVYSIWKAAHQDPDTEVKVIVLPFYHNDYIWDARRAKAHLEDLGVSYVMWNECDPYNGDLDAIIYTSPYDATRPDIYQFEALRPHIRVIAYVPYGLEVGGGPTNYTLQYGQPVTAGADAVFVRSERVRTMFRKYCPSGNSHVFVTGHPRMDGFADPGTFEPDPTLIEKIHGRTSVLWNPHFSIDGDLWSTFDQFAAPIFELFENRGNLALLFRPHPLLWKKIVNLGILDQCGIERLKQELLDRGVV